MANTGALGELQNQQWPSRRFEKTYGKKKGAMAQSRAIHFDLFGGGDENKVVDEMDRLTVKDDRESPIQYLPAQPLPVKQEPSELNPRLRGRRKGLSSRKMAVRVNFSPD